MTPGELRDLLLRLADSFERIEMDNALLRAVLQNAVPRHSEAPLEIQLDDLRRHLPAKNPVHERYERLRREIRETAEERRLQELFLRLPPAAGEPN